MWNNNTTIQEASQWTKKNNTEDLSQTSKTKQSIASYQNNRKNYYFLALKSTLSRMWKEGYAIWY